VFRVAQHSIGQQLTISSELVPFQEIDVYAKEAGFVKELLVDYGTHVRKGQLMAVLEIPELQAQLQQRKAAILAQQDQAARAKNQIAQVQAQHEVQHLQYNRLASVAKAQPGMVAQQEVDDARGRDLSSESQVEAAQGLYESAVNQVAVTKAQLAEDQALFDYARITAPFDGVVTQRYANLGALMQAGTNSTQATPLVRLSEENLFRLVIPVPESYVRYIKVGQPVQVRVPSLGVTVEGRVARFSVDVTDQTRTMHTEVDIPNKDNRLVPGLYAEAVLTPDQATHALVVPVQALNHPTRGPTVTVVTPDNRLQERPVTIGVQTANYVEIKSGVREGEPIVVSDRAGLRDGQPVKAKEVPPLVYESKTEDE
jgi:RND family efflux transporter MFP subunit